MDWMKILGKGVVYVLQIAIIIVAVFLIIDRFEGRRIESELSIREDIEDTRKHLVELEEKNSTTIELVTGVFDNNERVIEGLEDLEYENSQSRAIIIELGDDYTEFGKKARAIADRTLEGELITDGVRQLIRSIERQVDYNREEE